MLPSGESVYVCQRDRQTDGRTPNRCFTLSLDAVSVTTAHFRLHFFYSFLGWGCPGVPKRCFWLSWRHGRNWTVPTGTFWIRPSYWSNGQAIRGHVPTSCYGAIIAIVLKALKRHCFVLFCSRPRSEGWPHHGRTFSIYICPLSFWLTLSRIVLSTYWCCPSRPCVVFLACVHLALFLAGLHYLFLQAAPLFPQGVTIVR